MPTGKRNVVFVDKGEGKLEPRIVELGDEIWRSFTTSKRFERRRTRGRKRKLSDRCRIKSAGRVEGFDETPSAGQTHDQPDLFPENRRDSKARAVDRAHHRGKREKQISRFRLHASSPSRPAFMD